MKCPECGEELQPGVRVCPNCEYELSDAEMAQNGGAKPSAPEKPAVQAPQKPSASAPERPAGYKPQKPAQPEVAMPESIMSHGDVNVSSNQDHSVHQTQNTTNNTQNNTTNNTQQTIIINVGAGGQLPGGIVDDATTRAVNEVAQQQAQQQAQQEQQRRQQQQKPQQQKPQQQKPQEEPTFSDHKPAKDEKGVGSITGEGTIYVQTGRKMPGWLIAVIIVVVIGVAGALVFGGGKKASPEPEGQKTEAVSSKPAKTTPATKTTSTTKTTPATKTTESAPASSSASTTTTSTQPATTTSRAVAPAQADPYQDGMNAYNSGDYGRAVDQLSKAAASSEKKKAADAAYKLGLMYETGDGVAADKKQAIEWYQKAAKLGSKEAKRKLM